MKTIRYIGLMLLLLSSFGANAQRAFELNNRFGFKDYCFDGQIKTILLFKGNNELSDPVIGLGSDDVITVMFDDLSEGRRSLFYTITHCDADWNEDGTFLNDFMTGFAQNNLRDFRHAINTRTPYVHYSFTIPNRDINLIISGNYLLKVYDRTDPNTPLFQKGFSLVEPGVGIRLQYENLTNRGRRQEQQLNFSISHAGLSVMDPHRDFKLRVEQNSRRMPGIENPRPAFISGNTIDYSQPNRNIYPGSNEFRVFDIRTLEHAAQGVSLVDLKADGYHVLLNDAEVRADGPYLFTRDLNGRLFIDYRNRFGSKHTEADYAQVYFTLPIDEPYPNATLYVFGQLSDWSVYDSHAMVYNHNRRQYELTLTLKQGIYNYMIVAVDNRERFDAGLVEGNFSETENDYTVYVYFRSPRDRWDRLVGVEQINTLTRRPRLLNGMMNF